MKRIFSALLAIAAAAALVALPIMSKHNVTAVHAQTGCSNATLTGGYGFMWTGFTRTSEKSKSVPWFGSGVGTFDGVDKLSLTYSGSTNGQIYTNQTYTATYTVNPDCSGSMISNNGPNFAMSIVSGGAEVFLVDTSVGDTMTTDGKKQ